MSAVLNLFKPFIYVEWVLQLCVCVITVFLSQDWFFILQQRSSVFFALRREPLDHSFSSVHTLALHPLHFLIGPVRAPRVSRRVEPGRFYFWSRGSGDGESSQRQKSCLNLLVIFRETVFTAPVLLRICTDPLVLKFILGNTSANVLACVFSTCRGLKAESTRWYVRAKSSLSICRCFTLTSFPLSSCLECCPELRLKSGILTLHSKVFNRVENPQDWSSKLCRTVYIWDMM